MYKNFFKRLIDLILSLMAFTIVFPFFIVVLIGLVISNNGKAFFLQERPGKNERIFKVIKFKTMNDKRNEFGELLPSIQRVTPIGSFVRKYSLDEIPQLLNVIKGDMSLVGPRPLLVQYLDIYTDEQKLRHNVRPGITGWAQINGRNSISWKEKFELDLYYINNLSFKLDILILIKTVLKVLKSSDINMSETRTVETFDGTN